MNIVVIFPQFKRRMAWLLLAVALAYPAYGARLVEETFPVLKTRTGTYTNVTVTTRADNYVFILHSTGMTSIKVPDLPVEVRRQLGYPTPDAPTPVNTGTTLSVAARDNPDTNAVATSEAQALKQLQSQWASRFPGMKINSEAILTMTVIALLIYLFVSYCWSQICSKAGSPGGFLVWLPLLKIFPILRAANMSGLWFLAFFVPVLNVVAGILLAVNITKARGKELWVALLLILPVTNLFAFLYLAFSSSAPVDDAPPSKYQPRRLQTA